MQKKRKKKIDKIKIAFILCCVTIPVLHWLIFYVYANLSAILMAFKDINGNFSLWNFKRFFEEFSVSTSDISIAFRNTFITFGLLVVTYPFKVLVSFFIYKKVPFYGVYRVLFYLPHIIFSVAFALIFTRFMSVDGFIAQYVGEQAGLDYVPDLLADSEYANYVVFGNLLWLQFPGDLIIWGGTFARIPGDVLESGRIDGTTWWSEFTRIVVPMVWPTVALQMVLLTCGIFGATGNVYLLTQGKYGTVTLQAWMYREMIQKSGSEYTSNAYNFLSAMGLLLSTVAIIISLIVRKFTDKAFEEVEY